MDTKFKNNVRFRPPQTRTSERELKVSKVLSQKQPDLTIVCENIHDPHNISAILRTCDAVGVLDIHLLYTIERFPELSTTSSAGILKWMQIHKHSSNDNCIAKLQAMDYNIYTTQMTDDSIPFCELDFTQPTAFIMGNEHRGVSPEIQKIAKNNIQIPMYGFAQSLNVSVATAILLYEAVKQRENKNYYDNTRMEKRKYESLKKIWLSK